MNPQDPIFYVNSPPKPEHYLILFEGGGYAIKRWGRLDCLVGFPIPKRDMDRTIAWARNQGLHILGRAQ